MVPATLSDYQRERCRQKAERHRLLVAIDQLLDTLDNATLGRLLDYLGGPLPPPPPDEWEAILAASPTAIARGEVSMLEVPPPSDDPDLTALLDSIARDDEMLEILTRQPPDDVGAMLEAIESAGAAALEVLTRPPV